jgi:hypothetical protein
LTVDSRRLSDAAIARALGISKQQFSKDRRRGCPNGSVEAARRWRAINIELPRSKLAPRMESQRTKAPAASAAVARVRRLASQALQDFSAYEDELRAALMDVPGAMRAQVQLPPDLWRRLCEWWVLFALDDDSERPILWRIACGDSITLDESSER